MIPNLFSKPTSQDWQVGHLLLDDYEVMEVLGEGGMGKVYLVRSLSTGSQFAVKRAKYSNDADRKSFLAELQTWIDLPDHSNLVSCRFFRTVGDEIIIFADYIAGGTLANWIAKRKLTTLEQILDVAIQLAWGLHAMHELGLIHQDVKPGNVIMTDDGIPMITDFGLARALQPAAHEFHTPMGLPTGQQSILVSSKGMTPAYASPEQKAAKRLSRKTDIWSWAVSILDIFMGGVSCPYGGNTADHVLKSFIEIGESESGLPELPQEVADILLQCFVNAPPERPESLSTVSDDLIRIYEKKSNQPYARIIPRHKSIDFNVLRLYMGAERRDPSTWLVLARKFAGYGELSNQKNPRASSRMGMCVGDIINYEEAVSLLRHSVSDVEHPTIDVLLTLAGTLEDYALTLAAIGQRRRAVELAREAVFCYTRTDSQSVLESIEYHVALHYLASMLDTHDSATEIVSLAGQILSMATPRVTQAEWNNLFVCATLQHDSALQVLGDSNARSKFLFHALSVYPRDHAAGLGRSFLVAAAANVAAEQGDIEGAIRQYEEAIAVRREALARDQCSQRHASLFTALSNVANLYMRNENYSVAIACLQEASTLLVFLVDSAGQLEFSQQLISVYIELSRCYLHTKQHAEMKEVLIRAESMAQRVMLTNDGASAIELMMPILALRAKLAADMDDKMEVSYVSAKMTAIHQGESVPEYVYMLAGAYAEKAHRRSQANDPDALGEFQKCYWLLFGLQQNEISYDACRSAMCAGFDLAKHLNSMPDCYPESRRVSIESANIGMRLNRENPDDRNGRFLRAETWLMVGKMQSSYNVSLVTRQESLKEATELYEDLLRDGGAVSDDQAYVAGDAFAYLIDVYLMRKDCSAAINLAENCKRTLQKARPYPHSVDVAGILLVFDFFEALAGVMLTPSDLDSRAQMKSTSSRLVDLAFRSSSKNILQWSKAISSTEQEINKSK